MSNMGSLREGQRTAQDKSRAEVFTCKLCTCAGAATVAFLHQILPSICDLACTHNSSDCQMMKCVGWLQSLCHNHIHITHILSGNGVLCLPAVQLAKNAEESKKLLTKTETKHVPGKEPFRRHVLPPHVMELLLQVMCGHGCGGSCNWVRACNGISSQLKLAHDIGEAALIFKSFCIAGNGSVTQGTTQADSGITCRPTTGSRARYCHHQRTWASRGHLAHLCGKLLS